MMGNKRKRWLFAFSSIAYHQAGPPHQTEPYAIYEFMT